MVELVPRDNAETLIEAKWKKLERFTIDQYLNAYLKCTQCQNDIILPFRKDDIQQCPVCDKKYAARIKNGKFEEVLVER